MKQEMTGQQWYQLDHIRKPFAPRSTQITTLAPHLSILQAGCSSWRPTNSVKSTERKRWYLTEPTKNSETKNYFQKKNLLCMEIRGHCPLLSTNVFRSHQC